jgi:hypothetical protein
MAVTLLVLRLVSVPGDLQQGGNGTRLLMELVHICRAGVPSAPGHVHCDGLLFVALCLEVRDRTWTYWRCFLIKARNCYAISSCKIFRCFCSKLTPWNRVLPEKLTVPHLVKKFPALYGTPRFITAIKSAYPETQQSGFSIALMVQR